MSTPKSTNRSDVDGPGPYYTFTPNDPNPPTYASFSPANLSTAASAAKRRSTILVHQKSPLLLATPPQVTRALAYSHPFLLPLNKLVGLLTWSTGDPWESFLVLAVFWAAVQYGDAGVRFAGPIIIVMGLIAGMYARRYSPLSSSGWTEHPSVAGDGKNKNKNAGGGGGGSSGSNGNNEGTSTRHQKTLDEIVDTLKVFTTRCNLLLEPLLELTDFLSTQRTATSATTRPALTTLFVRILAITPVWVVLTLPPLRIITTKRVVMLFGTLVLTWHSRVCRVSRTLLWRSASIRRLARLVTGLQFEEPVKTKTQTPQAPTEAEKANGEATAPNNSTLANGKKNNGTSAANKSSASALTAALKRSNRVGAGAKDTGVRFTFILYENQRRWLGLGWTNSLFAYERATWTDEHNNPVPPKDEFELPEVEDGPARWRWVRGSRWRVDGVPELDEESEYDTEAGRMGWVFYDNKWQNGRRGTDGWGRWTRRRKWYRDAELVEDPGDTAHSASPCPSPEPPELPARPAAPSTPVRARNTPPTTTADLSTSNPEKSTSQPDTSTTQQDENWKAEEDDAVSMLSTSSKSVRFNSGNNKSQPNLRRRTTSGSGGGSGSGTYKAGTGRRSRRTSEAGSLRSGGDSAEGSLTPALELEIQGSLREEGRWGVGDEILMGLE
ncbi:Pex24p-domain-containing protein [Xylariaceae sp. FL0662B]|nr:Pex24p-domain-containing protein [Xylariaceae sp. FL0662B]